MNVQNIKKIYDVYDNPFKPPLWAQNFSNFAKFSKTAHIYYTFGATDYKDLAIFRDPVNIYGMPQYDREKIRQAFFPDISEFKPAYTVGSSNIAIYTKTPIFINDKYYETSILNIIAPALDNKNQPDYLRISRADNPLLEYTEMMRECFNKIKKCMKDHPNKTLVLHGFGLGNFAIYAKSLNIDVKRVFNNCYNNLPMDEYDVIFNNIDFMKTVTNLEKRINKPIATFIQECPDISNCVIVNAFDPFSFAGNGNSGDRSLDGNLGRISAISVLCWPLTNTDIRYSVC